MPTLPELLQDYIEETTLIVGAKSDPDRDAERQWRWIITRTLEEIATVRGVSLDVLNPNDITRRDIAQAVANLRTIPGKRGVPRTGGTVAVMFNRTAPFFRWLTGAGYLDRNPMDGMRRPRATRPVVGQADAADVEAIWNAAGTKAWPTKTRLLLALLATTGSRMMESHDVLLSDVGPDGIRCVAKGGHGHWIPILPDVRVLLDVYLAERAERLGDIDNPWLFVNEKQDKTVKAQRQSSGAVLRRCISEALGADRKVGIHGIRRGYAAVGVGSGSMDERTIETIQNRVPDRTYLRYARPSAAVVTQAATEHPFYGRISELIRRDYSTSFSNTSTASPGDLSQTSKAA